MRYRIRKEELHPPFQHSVFTGYGRKAICRFPICDLDAKKRNGLEFLPGNDHEHSGSIFVHLLAEALRSDIKSILLLSNFFAGEMDGSEA